MVVVAMVILVRGIHIDLDEQRPRHPDEEPLPEEPVQVAVSILVSRSRARAVATFLMREDRPTWDELKKALEG